MRRHSRAAGALLVLVAASSLLSSCSSGGTSLQVAAAAPVSAHGTATVMVKAANPDWAKIAASVEREIADRLREKSTFASVTRSGESIGRQPDTVIRITLTDVRDVSEGARNVIGAFAGRGRVIGDLEILGGPDGPVVARATVAGKTSWGTHGAGTTEQAIGIFADQAVTFIAANTSM